MLDDIGHKFNWDDKYRRILNNHPVSSSEYQLLTNDVLMAVNYFRGKNNEDGEYISKIMHETMNYFHGAKYLKNKKENEKDLFLFLFYIKKGFFYENLI